MQPGRLELGDPTACPCSHPPPVPSIENFHLLGERFLCQPLGVYPQWPKNRLGIFFFPHLSGKLKEREGEGVGDALAGHKSVMSWNYLRGNFHFMLCRKIPESPDLPSSPSDDALEIPPWKTLNKMAPRWARTENHFSLLWMWIYFRVVLTFARTFI